jgi:hypothetical protein
MLSYRKTTTKDYEDTLTKWWSDWRWTAPSLDFLPEDGIVVSSDGIDVCACYIYNTNSKVMWMEFIISNMDVKDKSLRMKSLQYMFDIVKAIAGSSGKKYIMCNTKNQPLVNKLSQSGFLKGSENVTEMICIL